MKKTILAAALAAFFLQAPASFAANWLELQGNEAENAPAFKLWGLVQPTYMKNRDTKVSGLKGGLAAYNNHDMIPNLGQPDNEKASDLYFLRARPSIRGVMPLDKRINYFVMAEIGHNGLTREQEITLTDASLTFNHIPGARIRAGMFKLPTGEEALQGVQIMDYVNFSGVTDNLLIERMVIPAKSAAPRSYFPVPKGLSAAELSGSVTGFRDIGVQVYDWFKRDKWELAYAVTR